jgi:hypothetical protein
VFKDLLLQAALDAFFFLDAFVSFNVLTFCMSFRTTGLSVTSPITWWSRWTGLKNFILAHSPPGPLCTKACSRPSRCGLRMGSLVARQRARVPAMCVRACVPVCLSNTNDTVILLFLFS